MNRRTSAILSFSIAVCNAVCGGVAIHDGRVGSAVIGFVLAGALVALGINCSRSK